jgi:hypothetical protein
MSTLINLDGTDEFFDSRDVIARIEEIEAEWENHMAGDEEFSSDHIGDEDERDEYIRLLTFRDEADGNPDWTYGVTFIADGSYFVDYCREMLSDCGYIPADMPTWIELDMEKTADNMRADYSEVELGGTTYLYR